jgi:HK97 family phage prohead protease
MSLENNSLPYETKETKLYGVDEKGEFTGLASVYGVKDLGNDVVVKGAFTRTINNHKNVVTLLWQHKPDVPIGIGELSDTDKGLEIKGRINLAVQAGKDTYELLKQQAVKGLSIGYDPIDWEYKDGARNLKEIRLWEVSVVTFPMNPLALVDGVKAHTPDLAFKIIEEELVKPETKEATTQKLQSLLAASQPPTGDVASAEPDNTESDTELIHSLMELYQEMKEMR